MIIVISGLLLIISVLVGIIGASSISFRFYLNTLSYFTYRFGLSYRQYKAKDDSQKTLSVLSIGLFFFDIEIDFIKDGKNN